MAPISPLILQAQITPPAGGGSFGLADTTRLQNPFRAPMWLDEIRFHLLGGASRGDAWSSISVELKLGNLSITNGFVPISLLGKTLSDSISGEGSVPDSFVWKLPKPLFIPARELLRPTIYFSPYSGAPTKTVTVLYCCRPLSRGTPEPRVLQAPWVTYFRPPFLVGPNAADTTDQSTSSDIFNPFDQDLYVQRFVGRLMVQGNNTDASNNMSIGSANVSLTLAGAPIISGTLVSAQDSMNNILIRDPTPFAHVFDFIDRSWTVNCVLPPKGFYLFTIDRLWSAYALARTATVGISMVGWREVAL